MPKRVFIDLTIDNEPPAKRPANNVVICLTCGDEVSRPLYSNIPWVSDVFVCNYCRTDISQQLFKSLEMIMYGPDEYDPPMQLIIHLARWETPTEEPVNPTPYLDEQIKLLLADIKLLSPRSILPFGPKMDLRRVPRWQLDFRCDRCNEEAVNELFGYTQPLTHETTNICGWCCRLGNFWLKQRVDKMFRNSVVPEQEHVVKFCDGIERSLAFKKRELAQEKLMQKSCKLSLMFTRLLLKD